MPVYIRYPCPNCSQNLSLRLEYVNRRVVCNFCKHHFVSRAKIRVPATATPELAAAIAAANRGEGVVGADLDHADDSPSASHVMLAGSAEHPQLDLNGTGDHAALGGAVRDEPRLPPIDSPGPATSHEMEDLRAELDRLLAQIEAARSRADEAARVEAELRSARAECEQLRVTVRILKADLAKRTPDSDRLRLRVAELERALAESEERRATERVEGDRHAPSAELDRLREQAHNLAAERDAALREAGLARRERAVHQAEAERLGRELEQVRQEHGRVAKHGHELADDLQRLGEELERQAREREAERQAHRNTLEAMRHEWEARLRAAESAGRRKEAEALHARVEEVRGHAEQLRADRDAALRLVEDLSREQKHQAERVAGLVAERERTEAERLAGAAELERLRERLSELEQARGGGATPQADVAIARREEERRALMAAAERIARERDSTSAQLGETLIKLEDALGRVANLSRQLEAEREARRAEAEAALEQARAVEAERAARQQEREKGQADAERLARELEKAAKAKEAEAKRGREHAEKAKALQAALEEARLRHEAESHAQQLAIEELRILLKYRQRADETGPAAKADMTAAHPAEPAEPLGEQAGRPVLALEHVDSPQPGQGEVEPASPPEPANGEAPGPDGPETPLDLAFGPNAPESPDERIAALRVHLRKIHEAEEERMKNRILRRLTRVWRSDSK